MNYTGIIDKFVFYFYYFLKRYFKLYKLKIMYKIIIIAFSLFALFSCWSWEEVKDELWEPVQVVYDSNDFSITIPSKWEVLKNVSDILPKPANWEIVFDAVSSIKNDDFYRNILVLKQKINSQMTSLDFTIWNYIWAKKEYFYIKQLAEKNVKIDKKNTKLYEFDARYSEDTPIVKFLQTWLICNDNWYIITIALEKNNLNIERYEWLLASFKCKDIKTNSAEQ